MAFKGLTPYRRPHREMTSERRTHFDAQYAYFMSLTIVSINVCQRRGCAMKTRYQLHDRGRRDGRRSIRSPYVDILWGLARRDQAMTQSLPTCAFWDIDSYRPSSWTEHVPFAFWLIDALRPKRLVELGTLHGMSYLAFCQAIKTLDVGTVAVAIDTWGGDPHAGRLATTSLQSLRQVHDDRYASFSSLLQSTFDDAAPHFAAGSIDLLHIDGFHTFEAVKHDFETWLPKVGSPGVVLFHDTQVKREDFGVHKLWLELSRLHPHFEFYHGNGLGVLGVGDQFPKPISDLFRAARTPADAMWVRSQFERLGRRASSVQLAQTLESDPVVSAYLKLRRVGGRVLRQFRG
jgi:hypothetical protein